MGPGAAARVHVGVPRARNLADEGQVLIEPEDLRLDVVRDENLPRRRISRDVERGDTGEGNPADDAAGADGHRALVADRAQGTALSCPSLERIGRGPLQRRSVRETLVSSEFSRVEGDAIPQNLDLVVGPVDFSS